LYLVVAAEPSRLQGLARAEGVDPGRANREAMPDLTAKRTLVKSPPELWSELSEVERLARHLGAFGEIKITKLEPEHTVAWEGEGASGTVSIEPSGWGTKVTLTAQLGEGDSAAPSADVEEAPAAETTAGEGVQDEVGGGEPEAAKPVVDEASFEVPEVVVAAEPVDEPFAEEPVAAAPEVVEPIQSEPRRRRGFLAWLFRPRTTAQVSAPPVVSPYESVVEAPAEEAPAEEEPVVEELATPAEAPPSEEPPPVSEVPPEVPEPPPLAEELAAVEQGSPRPGFDPDRAQAILDEALDALGSAHHRPFSRG
jgi:hypothetical protein